VAYYRRDVHGRRVHVVQVDLNQPEVKIGVATAAGGIGSHDNWSRIISRTRPTAAITGTYFDVASALPVGTIITSGTVIHRGSIGSSMAIRPDNRVEFAYLRPGVSSRWDGFETVLRAGPRLVVRGQVRLTPIWEGFHDRAVYARKPRAAVGLTRRHKLLLVTVSQGVLLREIAAIMKELGAVEALCMDGGSSAGLYCRGKSYTAPRRELTNLLVVYESADRYRRSLPLLAPGGLPLVSRGAGAA
jgi:exopolysaccharide biosynthesis protein